MAQSLRSTPAACAALALPLLAAASPPDHTVIVIEENHSFSRIIGNAAAPFMNSLATNGANFTNFYAITHPSQPNYLQLFSGASQGITNDSQPTGTPFSTPNLGAALISSGHSFAGYSQGLPAIGSLIWTSGPYARKHNPWSNWQSPTPLANQLLPTTNLRFTDFPSDYNLLPTVSFVVPDLNNDMHDGTIAQADAWLQTYLGPYAAWCQDHNSLLIITWDEDETAERNRIPTIFYGPMVRQGEVSSTWTLHNLQRTIEDLYGAPHSGSSANVRTIVGALTSDPVPTTISFRQGANAYSGAVDTFIDASAPTATHAADTILVCDGSPINQALIRFDDIIGANQLPAGAIVLSAKLMFVTGATSGDLSTTRTYLHRMLTPWQPTWSWDAFNAGVSTDNTEAAAASEFDLLPNILDAWHIFDVTSTIQSIADGQPNHGWLLRAGGTDGWRFRSSDSVLLADRPILEVTFITQCPPDFDHDGFVTGTDFDLFVTAFEDGDAAADFDHDGFLTGIDFDLFVSAFEAGC